jgi:dTMP kinase
MAEKTKPRGYLITFEGVDAAGKSTQIDLLTARLKKTKHKVEVVREPGGTVISEKIRELLLDVAHREMNPLAELFLYEAARAQLVHQKIHPALEKGWIVICDRFTDSSYAYQGYGRELSVSMIKQLNAWATGGIKPDITFFIDVPQSEARKRKKNMNTAKDRLEHTADEKFYEEVRKGYLELADQEPTRLKVVDGTRSVEEIEKEIFEIINMVMTV